MATIAKTKTWAAGNTVAAADLNGNFDTVYQLVNGQIDNANIKSAAGIAETKIDFATPAAHTHYWKAIVWNIPSYLYVDAEASPAGIFRAPTAKTLTACYLNIETAPTGADLIIDILKWDTVSETWISLWATNTENKPTIADGAVSGNTTDFDTTAIVAGDLLKIMIDQVGSTVSGANLSIELI